MSRQAAVLKRFVTTTKKFILLNPTELPIKLMWHSETRWIPAGYTVTEPHHRYADVPHSAKYAGEDTLIPGTLEISDIYEKDEQGNSVRVWDAEQAVKEWLGVNVNTGQATGGYAQRGLSLLSDSPTRDEVLDILRDARERAINWELASARLTIAEQDARNEARRKVGMPQIPGDNTYVQAVALLSAYNEAQQTKARKVVAEFQPPPPSQPVAVPTAAFTPEPTEPPEDPEPEDDELPVGMLAAPELTPLQKRAQELLNPPSLADKFHKPARK